MISRTARPTLLAAAFLVAALALAACNGGGGAAPASNAPADDAAPVDAPMASAGDPVAGGENFGKVCATCHGPDGMGIEGLGKSLVESQFFADMTDEEAVAFIQQGRPATHPDNTTGVDMPPRGGNPALTDEDLLDIVAYVRTIHE